MRLLDLRLALSAGPVSAPSSSKRQAPSAKLRFFTCFFTALFYLLERGPVVGALKREC